MQMRSARSLVLLSVAAALAGVAHAGNYATDLPGSDQQATGSRCAPSDLGAFRNEGGLSQGLAKCGISIEALGTDGNVYVYSTKPITIFEDSLAGGKWTKSTRSYLGASGHYVGTDGHLYLHAAKKPPKLVFKDAGSLPATTEWWTQNDDFESGDTMFLRAAKTGALWYQTTLYDRGGETNLNRAKPLPWTEAKGIKFVGEPAAIPRIRQPMVHVFVRSLKNELEEWVYGGGAWSGPTILAKSVAGSPLAESWNAHAVAVKQTRAKLVRRFSCEGQWPAKASFTDLLRAGCWTCDGGARTVHAVDSETACAPATKWSKVASKQAATGFLKTDCAKGFFLHQLSGMCYKCPAGYGRSLEGIDGGRACFQDLPWTKATYLGQLGCPKGSFRNGLTDNCYECPGGGDRTIFPGNKLEEMDNACEQKDLTRMSVYYLGEDGHIHKHLRANGGQWTEEARLPKGPPHPPFRVPDLPHLFAVDTSGKLVYTWWNADKKAWEPWTRFSTQPPVLLAGPARGDSHFLR